MKMRFERKSIVVPSGTNSKKCDEMREAGKKKRNRSKKMRATEGVNIRSMGRLGTTSRKGRKRNGGTDGGEKAEGSGEHAENNTEGKEESGSPVQETSSSLSTLRTGNHPRVPDRPKRKMAKKKIC